MIAAATIAYRDFHDAETVNGSLQDQLHSPPVGCLLQFDRLEDPCAGSAERSEVADRESVETVDQFCGQPIAKRGVQGECTGHTCTCKTRTDANVGASVGERSEEKWELRRPIAVIAVQKNDNVGSVGLGQPGQAGLSVAATRFGDDSGAHPSGDGRGFVRGAIVHNNDFVYQTGGKIAKDAANRLGFVAGRNDYADAHLTPTATTARSWAGGAPGTSQYPTCGPRFQSPAQAKQAPAPTVPKSTTCPIPRPTGWQGTRMRRAPPDA